MKKLGILGGSFNPIHKGHIELGLASYKEFNLDKVLFIPSGISYFKRDIYMPSGEVRLSMIDIAIKEYDFFESSDMEIKRPGDTHTVDTLHELKNIFPDYELYFIGGADTLYSIEKWVEVEEIFKLTNLIISVRNGIKIDDLSVKAKEYKERYSANILFLESENFEISSTEIRSNISNYDYLTKFIPKGVCDYIYANKIYF